MAAEVVVGLGMSDRILVFVVLTAVLAGPGRAGGAEQLARWRAARQGDPEAKLALGVSYLEGDGVPADPAKAWLWIRRAADEGLAEAQFRLARLYYGGIGTEKDLEASVRWDRLAAEPGHPEAKRLLRKVAPPPRPSKQAPAPPPRRSFSQHMDDVWADIQQRQQSRDAYISSQRRAFNDYLDRTGSTFAWRYE